MARGLTKEQARMMTIFFCFLIVGIVFVPLILFFSVTMLPSLFIFFLDRSPERIAFRVLAVLNFIGSIHAVFYSLENYESFKPISNILGDVWNWILPYGMVAFGVGVFITFPPAIETWMSFWLNKRENRLRSRQKHLLAVWGEKIRKNISSAKNDGGDVLEKDVVDL